MLTLTFDVSELHTMSMRLVTGGTYNVRASEMAAHVQDRQPKTVTCVVHFLDDAQKEFEIDKRAKSQHLLDKVFSHLELVEKDYFGLQFVDLSPVSDGMVSHSHMPVGPYAMRWLDPLKTIKKQCRGPPFEFYFRVKFYVSDPSKLAEEYTRYHFFLQVKRDIVEGRLVCPAQTAALLASYAVQSELGDYNPEEHKGNYLAEYQYIPNQTEEFEKQVVDLHKQHRGQNPAEAELNYLDKAKRLEMYGVDLHIARDQSNIDIQLGVTSVGLVVFQNNVKINTFPWAKIVKISFKRKQFFIQLRREVNDSVENLIGFNMISYRSCKNLWKSCVEHHTFFRLYVPNPPSKKIFTIGSKFSGRTEYQSMEDNKRRAKIERSFSRSPSKRYARRTVSGHTRDVIIQEKNYIDGYRNIPKSQTFSGTTTSRPLSSTNSHHSFNRFDGVSNQTRATLPHDYKMGSASRSSLQSEKSDDLIVFSMYTSLIVLSMYTILIVFSRYTSLIVFSMYTSLIVFSMYMYTSLIVFSMYTSLIVFSVYTSLIVFSMYMYTSLIVFCMYISLIVFSMYTSLIVFSMYTSLIVFITYTGLIVFSMYTSVIVFSMYTSLIVFSMYTSLIVFSMYTSVIVFSMYTSLIVFSMYTSLIVSSLCTPV
ncbi:hypothetical protein FSP39_015097 [Pinctada imbricata]|uniref:FERM domain-containing protein n=1 Tax=Pinctada imbricata TaxID=66713 RepID=A0AA89CE13_PINIB|nr:hypothetical protein FSP39_015097 [Pinctada imbricata]